MNEEEYNKWIEDARTALSLRYSAVQTEAIIDFFRRLKGSNERELVGEKMVNHICKVFDTSEFFDVYDAMMARIWIYGPYILREEGLLDERTSSQQKSNWGKAALGRKSHLN